MVQEEVKQGLSRCIPFLVVAAIGIALVLVFPHAMSAYHLEAGGRALDTPEAAVQHLQQAVGWNSANAQAYRLLGRAKLQQGDFTAVIQAFSRYTELRPGSPLGHLELAQAYETLAASSPESERASFETQAAEEWKRAGVGLTEFFSAGELALREGRFDEALAWYQRANHVEPDLGDPWYYIGQVYEAQQQWLLALDAYEKAATAARMQGIGRSEAYFYVGDLFHRRMTPPDLDRARAAYEAAMEADDFETSAEAADCHFRRGETLREQDADLETIVSEYRRALELDPSFAMAYVRIGQVQYDHTGDISMAEASLRKAVELEPDNPWIYIVQGDLYTQEGRRAEAIVQYELALDAVPGFEPAQQRLAALQGED